jgi:hypothetical protein
MQHTTTPPTDTRPSSADADDTDAHESLWGELFGTKIGLLLLGGGLLLILINVVVFFGTNVSPKAWLFYLDIRYWSLSLPLSIVLWTMVIGLVSEATDLVEDYRPTIRMVTAISVLLALVFALLSFFSDPSSPNPSLWLGVVLMVAVCCAVRSLFLFYDYRYEGGESIDLEEAQWFWGLSGILFGGFMIFGLMCLIPIKEPALPGMDEAASISLFQSFRDGLPALLQRGQGSFVLILFCFIVFLVSAAFVYVAGRWLLIFLSRMRGE